MPTSGHFEAISKQVDLLWACGQTDEARSILMKARQEAAEAGDEVFSRYFTGELACLARDFTTALQEEMQAANLAPGNPRMSSSVAMIYSFMRKYQDALEWSTKAYAIGRNNADALSAYAYALNNVGQSSKAIPYGRKAVKLDPDNPFSHYALGLVLMSVDRHEEATRSFREVIRLHPSYQMAQEHEAVTLGLSGKKAQALAKIKKLLVQKPQDSWLTSWLFRFEDDVRKLNELAAKSESEQKERRLKLDAWRSLSARTAHRIGNQVFGAKGAIHELKALATPEINEQIRDIEACHLQIQRICEEFRQFSTSQRPVFKLIDVNLLVQEALRRIQPISSQLTITPPDVAMVPECKWDQNQIGQALSELLENAVRHTPPGGRISVAVEPFTKGRKAWVRITVENTGEGVPTPNKKRIFDPFFTTRPGGTGLGLAIVEHTMATHQGTIIESGVPKEYARFVIEIPADPVKDM
jgi:signal transduction histidine kinase